jgi:dolichol-phosphate mannosyltransferase
MMLHASVVIPAYNEEVLIQKTLKDLQDIKNLGLEVLVVVDSDSDRTINSVKKLGKIPKSFKVVTQSYGAGPANAIRFGIDQAKSDCVVVMMADGSDDVKVLSDLVNLVNRGVAVACASRYMPGGQQIGGPRLKKFLSKNVGRILFTFAGVGTHDPTNSFKAYSREFVLDVGIESRAGFEIGIELVSKARRMRLPVAEIPTIWLDRTHGESRFSISRWAPKYLRWFFHSFGPQTKINTR